MTIKHPQLPAVATMVGMILGVGIFGVPVVYARLGLFLGLLMTCGITLLVVATHLLFAEIVCHAPVRLRLVQAAGRTFGPWFGRVVMIAHILGLSGALLAYIIAGGSFAAVILGLPDPFYAQVGLFLIFSLVAMRGRSPMTRTQVLLVFLLLGAIIGLAGSAVPYARLERLFVQAPDGILESYGVLLFALAGLPAIPTVVEALGRKHVREIRQVIVAGTLAAAVTTALFGFLIAAATGPRIPHDVIQILAQVAGQRVVVVAAVMGLLAVVTSFLALAVYVRDLLLLDARLPKSAAWAGTLLPPFLFFLAGARELTPVIAITGGVFGGIDGMIVAAISLVGRQKKKRGIVVPLLVLVTFGVGIIAHLLRALHVF